MVFLIIIAVPSGAFLQVDCIVGKFEIAVISEVILGNEHDIYVVNRNKCFQLVCMLYQAVGFPQGKL
jgi:hypothetical protein